jgi:2-dehydro-3-deoxygluconokinase
VTYTRLVGFGEAMLRLATPLGAATETTTTFRGTVGGAELNGLIAAARSGVPGIWVTALPDNPLGNLVLRHARANAVEPWLIPQPTGDRGRLGLYFLEMAAPPRPSRITYDRAGSAFAALDPRIVPWNDLLGDDSCLYVTGITPPLGSGPREALEEAIRTACAVGARVAVDANYRRALWSRDDFTAWLASVLPHADIVSVGAEDLAALRVAAVDPFKEAVDRFGLQAVVATSKRRVDAAIDIDVRVVTPDGEYRAEARASAIDQVGAGDALFGTFLAAFAGGDVANATQRALGAAVTCYGLFGDALVADPWDASEPGGVIR